MAALRRCALATGALRRLVYPTTSCVRACVPVSSTARVAGVVRPSTRSIVTSPGVRGATPCHPPNEAVDVLGGTMAYVDTTSGGADAAPDASSRTHVVFLHGNPTSSYLWRDVMPPVLHAASSSATGVRCLAPDLIGMGRSGAHPDPSAPDAFTFADHAAFLDVWFTTVVPPNARVVLVIHDWGSALGFNWARRHEDRVAGIVHMESVVGPVTWDLFPEGGRKIFAAMRTPGVGEEIVLQKNVFVDRILPSSVSRKLTDQEMAEYRLPYQEPGESRRPTLTWPRQIPFEEDGPQDVVDTVRAYGEWAAASPVPKLYVHAEPGFFAPWIKDVTASWANQRTVAVPGLHFVQEDSGADIGGHVAEFLQELELV